MSLVHVFKSTMPSINYIFKNGKAAPFVGGIFTTDVQSEIDELEAEVLNRHPHIYIDEAQKIVQSEMLDPLNALRAKFFEEFQKLQAEKTMDPNADMGTSESQPVKPASSVDIAPAAAGGSGTALGSRLAMLKAKTEDTVTVPQETTTEVVQDLTPKA
jgi:hypothetical protein